MLRGRFLKTLTIRTLQATVDVCRLMLGFWEADVCIYLETCTIFAKRQLAQRFLPWALVIILVRLLSCNPLVGLLRRRLFDIKP